MKKKSLIFGGTIFLILFSIVIISCLLSPKPVNAMMVGMTDMRKYDNNMYLERDIPLPIRENILEDFEKAKSRLLDYFNEVRATPTVIFVQSPEAIRKYTENPTGQTYDTFFGEYIVIGPKGFNQDVIAHELMHAEIRKRVKDMNEVPTWFDEGLATLVDTRYSTSSNFDISTELLNSIRKRDTFNDPLNSRENYMIAKNAVSKWFAMNGKAGLSRLIDGLNQGDGFDELFRERHE